MPSRGSEQSDLGFYSCGYYSAKYGSVVLDIATPEFFHGLDTADKYIARQYAPYPPSKRTSPSGLGPDSVEYWLPVEPGKVSVAMLSWTKSGNGYTLLVTATKLDRSELEATARDIYSETR